MLIDTHAHVNFSAFKDDADEVIRRALDNETWMINVGSDYRTSKKALELANKYEKGVYSAVGLHPIHLSDIRHDDGTIITAEDFSYDNYEKLAKFEKTVAVGEIGLDYYRLGPEKNHKEIKEEQKWIFMKQLQLAANLNLPAIIHCRQAHDDILSMLKDFKKENKDILPKNKPWAVMHCFSGDENLAWQYFSLGIIISFTGLITFSKQWDDLIRKLPMDKFMVETDSPYMTPEPFRGRRNEPVHVIEVAKKIAEIKNLSYDRIAEVTTATARNLFNL